MAPPFATGPDLGILLQRDDLPSSLLQLAVRLASGAIRAHCGWTISQETVTLKFSGYGLSYLWLPTMHLTAVDAVVEDGVTLVGGTDYDWQPNGRLARRRWSPTVQGIEVTFTHGYPVDDPHMELAEGVCLSAASRLADNPRALQSLSWTTGGESETVTYQRGVGDTTGTAKPGGVTLTAGEKADLAPLVLPVIA